MSSAGLLRESWKINWGESGTQEFQWENLEVHVGHGQVCRTELLRRPSYLIQK